MLFFITRIGLIFHCLGAKRKSLMERGTEAMEMKPLRIT